MCMVSMPPRMTQAQRKLPNPSITRVYRLTLDDVVQGLVLANLDGRFSLGVDTIERGQIGFALIDRHRLRGTVLIN